MSDDNDIIRTRREKLSRWRETDDAYANDFRRQDLAAALQERYAGQDKAALEDSLVATAVAGRVMLKRVMGKASFVTLSDVSGQIQCYLTRDGLGEAGYQEFKDLWDIGDIVGIEGTLMRTNKGELTVATSNIRLLNKTVRPLPEKWHGLTDTEARYRRRYLDLIMNEETRSTFRTRSQILHHLRHFFVERDFLEVETPMMHAIPGGAAARPFVTHHNSLDLELYLRIAPELYLKRLTVGGFERVFEINRSFRNEGLSTRHNPEFTMLEFYWAYADYRDLIELTGDLLAELTTKVLGRSAFNYQGTDIDFGKRPLQLTMAESIVVEAGFSESQVEDPQFMRDTLAAMNQKVEASWGIGRLQMAMFEARVEEKLFAPTFITHYPIEVSPLSRRNRDNPDLSDRFELFVGGREIANGFSELNDPDDQAERFRDQAKQKSEGDLEAMHFDADYVEALEYGLPPTAGEGIGIDRLVMLLTNSPSIRDVLLFPLMRPGNV
ncbi:MAG: lysine--tRNA ligase [Proteobacteria bacterium]|nr:lysine--tRNA ligase [Pseudomonadota bacterium]